MTRCTRPVLLSKNGFCRAAGVALCATVSEVLKKVRS